MTDMAELMDNDAVNDFIRRKHQETVEAQIAAGAAAAPARLLISYRDPSRSDSGFFRPVSHSFRENPSRFGGKSGNVIFRQRSCGRGFPHVFFGAAEILLNPLRVGGDKAFRLRSCGKARRPHGHLTGPAYAERKGSASRFNYCVSEFHMPIFRLKTQKVNMQWRDERMNTYK